MQLFLVIFFFFFGGLRQLLFDLCPLACVRNNNTFQREWEILLTPTHRAHLVKIFSTSLQPMLCHMVPCL
jgi:hypothetical protein